MSTTFEKAANNVLRYAANEQAMFTAQMKDNGYETKTTFYSDLAIAEICGGKDAILDTYNRVCKEWINNVTYFTEFTMALNIHSWACAYRKQTELGKLYAELYYKAYDLACETYNEKEMSYFFNTLD
jgi:hypothetical protein